MLNRTVITGDEMPEEPDDTPITVANPSPKPFVPTPSTTKQEGPEPVFETEAVPDTSITPAEEVPVMADEGALWTVDPSLGAQIPEVEEPQETNPIFDLDHTPEPVDSEPEAVSYTHLTLPTICSV